MECSRHFNTFVQEMNASGCTVQITAGSVANVANVQNVIRKTEYPIAGVLQMSMVLRVRLSCLLFTISEHENQLNDKTPRSQI